MPGEPHMASCVRFIILCNARTGSNMLASALHSSPEITCFRELFNTAVDFIGFFVDGYDRHSASDRELRDSDFAAFLTQRIFVEKAGVAAIGFKMPYTHFLGFPGLKEWLIEREDIRVLHLRRRNLLRMLVSTRIAKATGGWMDERRPASAGRLRPAVLLRAARHPMRYAARVGSLLRPKAPAWKARRETVRVSREECEEFFRKTELRAEYYDRLFQSHPSLTLHYEDLLDDRRATLDRAQTFLGATPRLLMPTTARQNPEPLRELIANYDALADAFAGQPYERFFD